MKLLILALILFLTFSTLAFAQSFSFKDSVIFSPDIAFLWNFQRGFEEAYRFVKFSSIMRIQYSLELSERRIGEIEVLASKNKLNIIPVIENEYEIEIDKLQTNFNSTDIFSKLIGPINVDIKENVTQRLRYNEDVLNLISRNVSEPTKGYITNAIKKTSSCIDFIRTR